MVARLYAERLAARWGRPVLVDSRPGIEGTPAVQRLLAQHDGDFAAVAAAPALPAPNLADLVEFAQRRPGALNWASSPGDVYMAFLSFVRRRGLDMNYVSYRPPAPALGDLAEGRVDAAALPLALAFPQAIAGRMRVLAVASPARSPVLPAAPTAAEAGFPELTFE